MDSFLLYHNIIISPLITIVNIDIITKAVLAIETQDYTYIRS